MHMLNVLDNQVAEFNAIKAFDSAIFDQNKHGLLLLEQLQTTIDLNKILTIFAREAAKYVDFSGLYFKSRETTQAISGSRQGKTERQFNLKINNKFIGILTYAVNAPISLANYKILTELHQYLLHPIKNAILYHQAMKLARQDALTALGNRRYFDEQLKRAMHHASRHQSKVGLILGDLNKFKKINDTYGHPVGDKVLKHFADALRESSRDSDSLFRFGGDEFAVLVESASEQSLIIIENRIKYAVNNDALLSKHKVSCSLGATFMSHLDNQQSFFERADKALYMAKINNNNNLSVV